MVYRKVSCRQSAYIHHLYTDLGETVRSIRKRFPQLSVATVWRHAVKSASCPATSKGSALGNNGRRKKLTARDERAVIRSLLFLREREGNFSARRVQVVAGMEKVHVRTIRRVLNRHGYGYRQARRKRLMSSGDRKRRVNFAKNIINHYDNDNIWKRDICFYLDGKSFVHKLNPKDQARAPGAKVWRRRNEGLKPNCTAKGGKSGHGGKTAHFFVAISYGKGVVYCRDYDKLTGKFFASLVDEDFQEIFKRSCDPQGNLFLQDGDPSQNSKPAKVAMEKIGAVQFSILPRSPDCNPIENLFNLIERKLRQDAVEKDITYEPFDDYVARIKRTLMNFPVDQIDKIIETMPGRMQKLIAAGGERLRY